MDASNVDVAITGGVAQVPSTWVPKSAKEVLPTGAKSLGLTNEDGIEITPSSSTESINSWQLGPIRTVITEAYVDYVFTAIENIKAVRELYYGSAESASGVIDWDPSKRVKGSFVFDAIDDADETNVKSQRHWVKNGEVFEVQPLVFNGTTPLSYGLTIRATRGADGKCARIFSEFGDITEPVTPTDPTEPTEPENPGSGYETLSAMGRVESYDMMPIGEAEIIFQNQTGNFTITTDPGFVQGVGQISFKLVDDNYNELGSFSDYFELVEGSNDFSSTLANTGATEISSFYIAMSE